MIRGFQSSEKFVKGKHIRINWQVAEIAKENNIVTRFLTIEGISGTKKIRLHSEKTEHRLIGLWMALCDDNILINLNDGCKS